MSKVIKLYTLNQHNVMYVNHTSKWFLKIIKNHNLIICKNNQELYPKTLRQKGEPEEEQNTKGNMKASCKQ